MKRKIFLMAMLLAFLPVAPVTAEVRGHIAFFYGNTDQSCGTYGDASSDLLYAYDRLKPWLEQHHFAYSLHESTEFAVRLPDNRQTKFDSIRLTLRIGIVLIKPGGEFKEILPGTDADIAREIETYFELE